MTHLERPECIQALKSGGKEDWGPCIWGELHEVADKIPCDECKGFGVRAIRAVHDMVNVKLGKPLFDREGFLRFARDVQNSVEKCHSTGRCSGGVGHAKASY